MFVLKINVTGTENFQKSNILSYHQNRSRGDVFKLPHSGDTVDILCVFAVYFAGSKWNLMFRYGWMDISEGTCTGSPDRLIRWDTISCPFLKT